MIQSAMLLNIAKGEVLKKFGVNEGINCNYY